MSTTAGKHVFISYSREDEPFVRRLSEDLRNAAIKTWLDTNEIAAGDNWQKAIEDSLRDSVALLYVASARTARSTWMATEVQLVARYGTAIIPLVLDDKGAADLPVSLKSYQWIDFRREYAKGLEKLLGALEPYRSLKPISQPLKKTKGYVFLSYADEDFSFVDDVKKFLADKGYSYWDYRESDRDYHNDLFIELEGVIAEAAAMLSFVSPDWKRSRIAVKEYHFSTEVGTPVFLLKVRDPGPTLVIAGLPYIDFTTENRQPFSRLERELVRKGL